MSMYDELVPQFHKMLGGLERWLEEGEAFATARELDLDALLTARLYPDQLNLTRNIQAATDTAKLAVARLAAVDAPNHEDGPATLPQLRARIAEVSAYLQAADRDAVDAGAARVLTLPFLPGQTVVGRDYVRQFAVPNFYFHLTTSYAILRNLGVKLGKRTFIGSLPLRELSERRRRTSISPTASQAPSAGALPPEAQPQP